MMPFEKTFLKLYTDVLQRQEAESMRSSETDRPAEASAAALVHSAEPEPLTAPLPADQSEAEANGKEDILYFSPWNRIGEMAVERYDAPQPSGPTERFRRLYTEAARHQTEEAVPEFCSPENSSPENSLKEAGLSAAAEKETAIPPAAESHTVRDAIGGTAGIEPAQTAENRRTSFSVTPYSAEEYPPVEESSLHLYGEEPAKEVSDQNRETVFNLSGQKQEMPSVSDQPKDRACPVTIPAWPESVERVRQRGYAPFDEWAETLRHEMARGFRIIGFGSTAHGAGTSTLMLGLAGEMAARHYSVLILDADFENPSLASQMGINPVSGWEKFLNDRPDAESESLYRITVCPPMPKKGLFRHRNTEPIRGEESFHFLPLMPRQAAAAVALSCRRSWLCRFLELADSFDLVLIDHGVVLTDDHHRKISEMLRFGEDGWFLIDNARTPETDSAGTLIEQAQEKDLICLGRIENFIE